MRDAFREAREVADLAAADPGVQHPDGQGPHGSGRRAYYRLPDLRLRGLLHLLREDTRLRSFAERELGPLLAYDAEHGTTLVTDLAAFLESGGNKALAASRAHLARPTFYQRLAPYRARPRRQPRRPGVARLAARRLAGQAGEPLMPFRDVIEDHRSRAGIRQIHLVVEFAILFVTYP